MKNVIRKLSVMVAFSVTLAAFAAVAYVISSYDVYKLEQRLICSDGSVCKAYFSPEDNLRELLLQLIEAEQESISFAIYTFTDKYIAQALIEAQKRGVRVAGIVDRSYGQSRYSKVCMLANARVPLFVYQTAANERQAGLMHNKVLIFGKNIAGKALLWTGSYNFTNRASCKNQENVVILDNPEIIRSFRNYLARLTSYSLQISGPAGCQEQSATVAAVA